MSIFRHIKDNKGLEKLNIFEKGSIIILNNFTLSFFIFFALLIILHLIPKKYINMLPKLYRQTEIDHINIFKIIVCFAIFYNLFLFMTFYAFDKLKLSTYNIFASSGVIATLIVGYLLLGEEISKKKLLGCAIIMIGVISEVYFKDNKHLHKFNLPSL